MQGATWFLAAAFVAFVIAALTSSGGVATVLWIGAGLTGGGSAILGSLTLWNRQQDRNKAFGFVTAKWTAYYRRRGSIELQATADLFDSEFEDSTCSFQVGDEKIPLTPDPIVRPHMTMANRYVMIFRSNTSPREEVQEASVDVSIRLRNGVKKHVQAAIPVVWMD